MESIEDTRRYALRALAAMMLPLGVLADVFGVAWAANASTVLMTLTLLGLFVPPFGGVWVEVLSTLWIIFCQGCRWLLCKWPTGSSRRSGGLT